LIVSRGYGQIETPPLTPPEVLVPTKKILKKLKKRPPLKEAALQLTPQSKILKKFNYELLIL
jgi:hypothetical protein